MQLARYAFGILALSFGACLALFFVISIPPSAIPLIVGVAMGGLIAIILLRSIAGAIRNQPVVVERHHHYEPEPASAPRYYYYERPGIEPEWSTAQAFEAEGMAWQIQPPHPGRRLPAPQPTITISKSLARQAFEDGWRAVGYGSAGYRLFRWVGRKGGHDVYHSLEPSLYREGMLRMDIREMLELQGGEPDLSGIVVKVWSIYN